MDLDFKEEPIVYVGMTFVIAHIIVEFFSGGVGISTAVEALFMTLGTFIARRYVVPKIRFIENIRLPYSS